MTIECRRCDRCDLLQSDTWRLAQRLADLERRVAATCATGWRTQWALRRLAERLGEVSLARLLADDTDDTEDVEKE